MGLKFLAAIRAKVAGPRGLEAAFAHAQSQRQEGRISEAKSAYRSILTRDPAHWDSLNALAELAMEASDVSGAIDLYDRFLDRNEDHPNAHYKRANVLNRIGRWDDALNGYDRAIELDRHHTHALCNRGFVLGQLGRFPEAIDSLDQALIADPADYYAWYNRASILYKAGRKEESVDSYNTALSVKADYFEALVNRGNVLRELGRLDAALRSYDDALSIRKDQAVARFGRGFTFKEQKRFPEAIDELSCGLRLDSSRADAFDALGFCLLSIGHVEEAIQAYERSLALNPTGKYVLGMQRHARMHICSWDRWETDLRNIESGLRAGRPVAPPFVVMSLIDSAALQRTAAEIWVREECLPARHLATLTKHRRGVKIKIGYFSADFRPHAVALLTADLFETHDRAKFEITAFSFGPDTNDSVRARLKAAFDRFIDVEELSDEDVAILAREIGIDIAVDLGGFTTHSRTKIYALRAAPIQLSYIGYLGTMGAPFMDYLVADAMVLPASLREYYAEKIVFLPSYQANDSHRPRPEPQFSREDLGLPATGFVYCCFNANFKITPDVFHVWMNILRRVPGSTLYLCVDNDFAQTNLLAEAGLRQIDEHRIVFGERLPFDAYLSRSHAMDLFLDTSPYNAGTTASDALWMGLPVLTCIGEAFAARVAASILTSMGLDELIAPTWHDYEERAVFLAADRAALTSIRHKLATNRDTTRLFDTGRFTQSLESAYLQIYDRLQDDLPPADIFPRSE